nr:hypothetical protein [Clostridium hominis]
MISGDIAIIINNVYKNQRAPITPFSGYNSIVLNIFNKFSIDKGSLSNCLKIMIIKLVINDIVKKGTNNLKNFNFIKCK